MTGRETSIYDEEFGLFFCSIRIDLRIVSRKVMQI
jgi:hypothetical protein